MTKTLEEERDTIDFVTDAMFSLSFLEAVNRAVFDPNQSDISLREFYSRWLKLTGAPGPKMPFSLGIFVGYLFCGLLITKENWSDLLPKTAISKLGSEWGLGGVQCTRGETDPTLSHFIRRLRNALGHTNIAVTSVPSARELKGDLEKVHDLTSWKFWDVNQRDVADEFEVTLTMRQLEILIKNFQSVAHRHMRAK